MNIQDAKNVFLDGLDAVGKALFPPKPDKHAAAKKVYDEARHRQMVVVTEAELDDLKKKQKAHATPWQAWIKLGATDPNVFHVCTTEAWRKHHDGEMEAATRGEQTPYLHRPIEYFSEVQRQKLSTALSAVKRVTSATLPIRNAIVERLDKIANEFADEVAATEKATADKWGVSYSESPTVLALRTAAKSLYVESDAASPASMLPFLNLG